MSRKRSENVIKLLNNYHACELCGNPRNLEVHHIIPVVCGGSDDINNLIVVCNICHAKLTPRKELTKIGLNNARLRGILLGAKPGNNNGGGRPRRKFSKEFINAYQQWKHGDISAVDAMQQCNIPKATFYRMVKRYEETQC